MDNERTAVITIGEEEYTLLLTTKATKEIAGRYGGLEKLSEKSGVSLGSLKRFERTGQISLLSLTKLAVALGMQQELERLFAEVPFLTIEEVINENDEAT